MEGRERDLLEVTDMKKKHTKLWNLDLQQNTILKDKCRGKVELSACQVTQERNEHFPSPSEWSLS